jgi:protoporphyrinogen oxidase
VTVVIVGAGIAGIGAGLALGEARRDFTLLESEDGPGGLVRTDEVAGFKFDRTGHFLHFKGDLLRGQLEGTAVPFDTHERKSAVLVGRAVVPYPIQYNLWALGSRRLARAVLAELTGGGEPADPPETFADLLLSSWGATLYEIFFRPYNEKLWGRPLTELPADCVGAYLPAVDLELAAAGAVGPTDYGGYNGTFFYPASGRLGDAADALADPLAARARYGFPAKAIGLSERVVEIEDGRTLSYDTLIATLPLNDLLGLVGEWPAPELFEASEILNVRIGFSGAVRAPHQWVYVPDAELPFHRIGFPGNVNGRTCPSGCASISVEYTYPRAGRRLSGEAITGWALDYLDELGLVELDEVLTVTERLLTPAYVVHRSPGRPEFEEVRELLARGGVVPAGRFGTWDYLSIEESFESGWRAGAAIREAARV